MIELDEYMKTRNTDKGKHRNNEKMFTKQVEIWDMEMKKTLIVEWCVFSDADVFICGP